MIYHFVEYFTYRNKEKQYTSSKLFSSEKEAREQIINFTRKNTFKFNNNYRIIALYKPISDKDLYRNQYFEKSSSNEPKVKIEEEEEIKNRERFWGKNFKEDEPETWSCNQYYK